MSVSRDTLLKTHSDMVRSRVLDKKLIDLARAGEFLFVWASGEGQEATCGVYSQLEPGDYAGYTHRGCYVWISRGIPMVDIIGEYCGRVTGSARGKGATHIVDMSLGVIGRSGMQGGHFALFAGTAIATQVLGRDRVSVCLFGEGAATSGLLHESMIHASTNRLPVIYVCETNGFDSQLRLDEVWPQPDIAKMGIPYNIPFEILDGNDPLAVALAAQRAIARARSGNGPTIMELKTYRLGGIFEPGGGQPDQGAEEVEQWRLRDPIKRMEETLLDWNLLKRADLERIYSEAQKEVESAAKQALESPQPAPEEAYTDIYAE